MLWSTANKPQRLTLSGVAAMPNFGRISYHTDEQARGRWRD